MSTETTAAEQKKSYKDSLNLPRTSFAMEAKLTANEPIRLERWQQARLYEKISTARAKSPKWILHDGPPFANGDIHIGHVVNKVLKDVFIRYKTMAGFNAPYVPGWDCHGLPIEHKISEKLGSQVREMPVVEVRRHCHEYAQKYVDTQSKQFQRLGILGDWSNPYLTMSPEYEAETLEVFARFVEAGIVYKRLKPVHWSIDNQTALADAELEYHDVEDASVFVEFPVENPGAFKSEFNIKENAAVSFLIWTTTPWTLPANQAIAVNPKVEYAFVKYSRNDKARVAVIAKELVDRVFKDRKETSKPEVMKTVTGEQLIGKTYTHPFLERVSKIVSADYVTTTDGTGLVHTAPGHGEDDYATGLANSIEVYSPVLANGRFDTTTPEWVRGLTVWKANPVIIDKLRELDALFAEQKLVHSYPHDWRSKSRTIFRATEQWFVAIDQPFNVAGQSDDKKSLRDRAQSAVDSTNFVPSWGKARIGGMLESRPDWCISRQRAWGLPIPVFYNSNGEALLTPESVRAVARHFGLHGSDAWFTSEPATLLGADFKYPNGFSPTDLRKEKDIFDVWFESGSSWRSVLQCRSTLHFPADLYLEGSDQHRGWFQLSLLPSLGATGQAPFKATLTHGFVVKPGGTKVSKSDKEYVTAMQEIERHGADLLRLWVCSVDYQGDIAASPQILKEFGDKYRKIRNTLRYLMSNLYDYDDAKAQSIPPNSLDGWAVAQLEKLVADTLEAYEQYQLHRVFKYLHEFCAVQISALYANAMKDRLYCEMPDSPLRRRAQTVMHKMLLALTKLLAPMIVFTADEAWDAIADKPAGEAGLSSVHLSRLPKVEKLNVSGEQQAEWRLLMDLRDSAMTQMDALLRKFPKQIKPSDTEIVFHADDVMKQKLAAYGVDLEDLVGAGSSSFGSASDEGVTVEVLDRREEYKACARSWKRRADVGSDAEFPDLCARDAAALRLKK